MRRRRIGRLVAFSLCIGVLTMGMARTAEAEIKVMNTNDREAGSLRQAIADAIPGETIDATSLAGCPCTIVLESGELAIDKNLTIRGPGPTLLKVAGNQAFRVFRIPTGVTARLEGLQVSDGVGYGYGNNPDYGGGILNEGTLSLFNVVVSNNSNNLLVGQRGGGIYSTGPLSITRSSILNNDAETGGGIYSRGLLTVKESTIAGNSAELSAGGIFVDSPGEAVIVGSTISNNTGNTGGGLFVNWTATLVNSTISGNQARDGGGGVWLEESGSLTLINTTVTGNTATVMGGGIYNNSPFEPVVLNNTIVTGNQTGDLLYDIDGRPVTNNNSLIGGNAAAVLLPLADNGGPTQTHALAPNSPAIDAGNYALLPADTVDLDGDANTTERVPVDQRGVGFPRVAGFTVDIGAVEHQPDDDSDGVPNVADNCPALANSNQRDTDGDVIGDACDVDDDNDGVPDILDWFPTDPSESEDTDRDGIGNHADTDDDNDGVADTQDAFPLDASESVDTDNDGIGNNTDVDDDGAAWRMSRTTARCSRTPIKRTSTGTASATPVMTPRAARSKSCSSARAIPLRGR